MNPPGHTEAKMPHKTAYKKGTLKTFTKFTGKHQCKSLCRTSPSNSFCLVEDGN